MKIFVVNCNDTSEGYNAELSCGLFYFQMKLWNMIQSPTLTINVINNYIYMEYKYIINQVLIMYVCIYVCMYGCMYTCMCVYFQAHAGTYNLLL